MFACALFGLAVSVFLLVGYLRITEIPCTDSGCDLVRVWHDHHLPRGAMPLLGTLYFLMLTVLSVMLGYADEKKSRLLSNALLGLSGAGVLFVLGLTYLEAAVIHAYCFWCLTIAGTALLFAYPAWNEWKSWKKSRPRYDMEFEPFLKWGAAPLALLFLVANSMGTYSIETPTEGAEKVPETALAHANFIRPDSHVLGPANAPVTLVEFADPGCPSCANQAPVIDQLLKKYPRQVRLVYRHFPLKSHKNSRMAAQAMEAAGEQGKFWEYHDILFKNYENESMPELLKYAKQLGLDMPKFQKEVESGKFADRVSEDRTDGEQLQVNRTPTLFINETYRFGPSSLEQLDAAVQQALQLAKASK
jgi:protein-disulfide isomerase/uncharacterized membrane protein